MAGDGSKSITVGCGSWFRAGNIPTSGNVIASGAIVDTTSLLLGLFFGSFGFAYFMYGKRQSALVPAVSGVLLMVFPYFVSNNYVLAGMGAMLMALPFLIRL